MGILRTILKSFGEGARRVRNWLQKPPASSNETGEYIIPRKGRITRKARKELLAAINRAHMENVREWPESGVSNPGEHSEYVGAVLT